MSSPTRDASASDARAARRRFPAVARGVAWLQRHPGFVAALTAASIVAALILDLVIPGYAIAGFYLFPVMLVAFALRVRAAIAVSVLCLCLAVAVMVLQDRLTGENILLIAFGALGGVGLIALAGLFHRVEELYESERSTIVRLQLMTARLETLQEVSVVVTRLPTSQAILDKVVRSGAALLEADCFVVTRDGSGLRTHAACSPYAGQGEQPPTLAEEAWPVAAGGARVHGVSLDAHVLGVDDPEAEAALVFVRPPGEPRFDREDEMLAATLGALLNAALDRALARV
jgi:hypothetical protein